MRCSKVLTFEAKRFQHCLRLSLELITSADRVWVPELDTKLIKISWLWVGVRITYHKKCQGANLQDYQQYLFHYTLSSCHNKMQIKINLFPVPLLCGKNYFSLRILSWDCWPHVVGDTLDWTNSNHDLVVQSVATQLTETQNTMPTMLSGNGLLEAQITRILVSSEFALSEYQFFRIFLNRKKQYQMPFFPKIFLIEILFCRDANLSEFLNS